MLQPKKTKFRKAFKATAWTQFTSIETPARDQRNGDLASAASFLNGVVTAATTIWTATESSARSFAESEIALAESIRSGTASFAVAELESDVEAAEESAASTITGLVGDGEEAWTDFLATLAPGETPAVSQQLSLESSLAMIPGLSSVVMASLLTGPPTATAPLATCCAPRPASILPPPLPVPQPAAGPTMVNILAANPNQTWVVYLFDAQPLGGVGHAAVLIGSEANGWAYFSFSTGEASSSYAADLDNLEPRHYPTIIAAGQGLTPYKPPVTGQSYIFDKYAAWKITAAGVTAGQAAAMTFLKANYYITGQNCDDLAVCTIKAAGIKGVVDAWKPKNGYAGNVPKADASGNFGFGPINRIIPHNPNPAF